MRRRRRSGGRRRRRRRGIGERDLRRMTWMTRSGFVVARSLRQHKVPRINIQAFLCRVLRCKLRARRGKACLRKRRRTRASQGGVFRRLGRLRPSLKDLPSHPRPLEDPTPRDARWNSTPPPSPSRPPKPAKTGKRRRLGLAIKLHRKGNARRPTALEWIQARRR